MNILITGGSGFIGTRLVDELKVYHSVKIYDKVISSKYPELTIQGDIRNVEAVKEACKGIDIIYNLAAEHADDVSPESLYTDVNVGGAKNVVSAAKANNIKKIIFTSTVAIYGLNRGEPNEDVDAKPFNEYGRTKYAAEKILIKWAKQGDNSLTILRPAVIFGENNRGNVYNLINQIANGRFIMIGDGINKKSMGYVGNIVKFLKFQIDEKKGIYIYNFADKPDLSSREIVDIIVKELGFKNKVYNVPYTLGLLGGYSFDLLSKVMRRKFSVSSIRIKKFTAETTVNTDRLLSSGFKAEYSISEGLRKMIEHEFK